MRKDQRIEALIDLIWDDGPTIHDGIQAIREMQAKSAGREDEYLDVYVQVSAENERLKEELHIARNSCNFGQGKRIMAGCDKALTEVDHLKEELRTLKNSWNFEEGKRIIGERDKLLKINNVLRDEQDYLRGRLDRIEALSGELRSERAAAMIERDDLRGKLRATEEAMDKAEEAAEDARLFLGRTAEVWHQEVLRLRGLMSEAKKLIDQGSCDA